MKQRHPTTTPIDMTAISPPGNVVWDLVDDVGVIEDPDADAENVELILVFVKLMTSNNVTFDGLSRNEQKSSTRVSNLHILGKIERYGINRKDSKIMCPVWTLAYRSNRCVRVYRHIVDEVARVLIILVYTARNVVHRKIEQDRPAGQNKIDPYGRTFCRHSMDSSCQVQQSAHR